MTQKTGQSRRLNMPLRCRCNRPRRWRHLLVPRWHARLQPRPLATMSRALGARASQSAPMLRPFDAYPTTPPIDPGRDVYAHAVSAAWKGSSAGPATSSDHAAPSHGWSRTRSVGAARANTRREKSSLKSIGAKTATQAPAQGPGLAFRQACASTAGSKLRRHRLLLRVIICKPQCSTHQRRCPSAVCCIIYISGG